MLSNFPQYAQCTYLLSIRGQRRKKEKKKTIVFSKRLVKILVQEWTRVESCGPFHWNGRKFITADPVQRAAGRRLFDASKDKWADMKRGLWTL